MTPSSTPPQSRPVGPALLLMLGFGALLVGATVFVALTIRPERTASNMHLAAPLARATAGRLEPRAPSVAIEPAGPFTLSVAANPNGLATLPAAPTATPTMVPSATPSPVAPTLAAELLLAALPVVTVEPAPASAPAFAAAAALPAAARSASATDEDDPPAAAAPRPELPPAVEAPALPEVAAIEAPPPPAPNFECPTNSGAAFALIPIASAPAAHPDSLHGDLNLALRGWEPTAAALTTVAIDGPADNDPPRLWGLFAERRGPAFTSAAQVYDWDWTCGEHGCRGALLTHREVLLLGVAATPGEAITPPDRGAQIYGGGYKALVLYAEPTRITLGYTRDDSVANGYTIHMEEICVDPALLAAYNAANAAGRGALPALRDSEALGTASGAEVLVAVRDRGVFFDPRSTKDWWRD